MDGLTPQQLETTIKMLAQEHTDVEATEHFFCQMWPVFHNFTTEEAAAVVIGNNGQAEALLNLNQIVALWLLGLTSQHLTVREAWLAVCDFMGDRD